MQEKECDTIIENAVKNNDLLYKFFNTSYVFLPLEVDYLLSFAEHINKKDIEGEYLCQGIK
jgi:hypothetical protein